MDPRLFPISLTRVISAAVVLLTTSSAWAQDQGQDHPQDQDQGPPWYQVEVVVFKHTDTSDTESWPDDPGAPDLAHTVVLSPPSASAVTDLEAGDLFADKDTGQAFVAFLTDDKPKNPDAPMAFRLLPGSDDQLGGDVTRLNNAGAYQVLYHAAWRQPAYAPENTTPVHIRYDPVGVQTRMLSAVDEDAVLQTTYQSPLDQGDGTVPQAEPTPGTPPTPTTPPVSEQQPLSEESSSPPSPSWLLNGEIGLTQSRYLHLDVDLVYQVNTPADPSQQDSVIGDTMITQTFRLQQSRRIRSDNIYYFDHPRFGVLAKVTPYTPPPPPPPPQTDDSGQSPTQQPSSNQQSGGK